MLLIGNGLSTIYPCDLDL